MIKAFSYARPFGHKTEIDVTDIEPADEKYLTENNIVVSMESLPWDKVALYGEYGTTREGNVKEAIVIVKFSERCRVGMGKLVESIKTLKGVE